MSDSWTTICQKLVPQVLQERDWQLIEDKFKSLSFTKQQARSFNRLLFSGAYEVVPDTQGRVLIPDHLKEFADIKTEIVIIGVSDRIEIWDKKRWNKFYDENRENFWEMEEGIFD